MLSFQTLGVTLMPFFSVQNANSVQDIYRYQTKLTKKEKGIQAYNQLRALPNCSTPVGFTLSHILYLNSKCT